jgi:hypothetical protein
VTTATKPFRKLEFWTIYTTEQPKIIDLAI